MSAPDPAGIGAKLAIERALARAGKKPRDVDYINLHGTGTVQNDAMEARLVRELFGSETPVSSTKTDDRPCSSARRGRSRQVCVG